MRQHGLILDSFYMIKLNQINSKHMSIQTIEKELKAKAIQHYAVDSKIG
jgi:hypothetical protein